MPARQLGVACKATVWKATFSLTSPESAKIKFEVNDHRSHSQTSGDLEVALHKAEGNVLGRSTDGRPRLWKYALIPHSPAKRAPAIPLSNAQLCRHAPGVLLCISL